MSIPVTPAEDGPWWMQVLSERTPGAAAPEAAAGPSDEDTDKIIVKADDRESDEVIRQIPSEEMVRIAKALGKAPGLLASQEA